MRTKPTIAVVAASVLAGSNTPAQAYTIEHIGTDCRVNYSITEMQNNRMYFPVYYTQEELKAFRKESLDSIAQNEAALERLKATTGNGQEYFDHLGEKIADHKRQIEIYDKCAKVPAANPATNKEGSSSSAALAGVLGGVIGAVAAVAAIIGMKDVLPLNF